MHAALKDWYRDIWGFDPDRPVIHVHVDASRFAKALTEADLRRAVQRMSMSAQRRA